MGPKLPKKAQESWGIKLLDFIIESKLRDALWESIQLIGPSLVQIDTRFAFVCLSTVFVLRWPRQSGITRRILFLLHT